MASVVEKFAALRTERRPEDSRSRQRQLAIDELMEVVEERNLRDELSVDHAIQTWLRRLEREVGVPVATEVLLASNTVRLHAALLDWLETVIHDPIPEAAA
jgi:hypothetical protein